MTQPHTINAVAQRAFSKVEFPVTTPARRVSVGGLQPSVRPMTEGDREMLKSFFNGLTDHSRFSRFMTPFTEVPSALLKILSNVSSPDHIAFMATVDLGSTTQMIGEVRFVISKQNASVAEFAIAVADDWQGKGLAGKLMRTMEEAARDHGVSTLIGTTLRSNNAMIELGRHVGYHLKPDPGEARAVRLVKRISAPRSLH